MPGRLTLCLLLMAACTVPPVATTLGTLSPGTTVATSTLVTTTTTPTTIPCGLGAVPSNVDDLVTEIDTDFDGDLAPDQVSAYLFDRIWHLRLELSGGGGGDIALPGVPQPVRPLGAFDLDQDEHLELFALVGVIDDLAQVAIFLTSECGLEQVSLDGVPAIVEVGRNSRTVAGAVCTGGIQFLTATRSGDPVTLRRTTYQLVGSALERAETDEETLSDSEARKLVVLDCPGVSDP